MAMYEQNTWLTDDRDIDKRTLSTTKILIFVD